MHFFNHVVVTGKIFKLYNKSMFYRNQNCRQRHKTKLQLFLNNLMRNQSTQQNNQSPRVSINYEQKQLSKTKTLKKHKYFDQNLKSFEGIKPQKKSQQSTMSDVLNELANYVEEKNSQIPWTKRYNWEDILVSSSKKSTEEEEKKEKKYKRNIIMQSVFLQPKLPIKHNGLSMRQNESPMRVNRMNFYSQRQQEYSSCTHSIKSNSSNSTIVLMQQKRQKSSSHQSESDSQQLLDFLFKQSKISQTQNIQIKPQVDIHTQQKQQKNYFDDDDDDDDELIMMVRREQERRANSERMQQLQLQQIDSPIVHNGRRRNLLLESPQSSPHQGQKRPVFLRLQDSPTTCKSGSQHKACHQKKQKSDSKKKQQESCCICIGQMQQRAKLPCKHLFCLQCLQDWLIKSSNCPMCRMQVPYYSYNGVRYKIEKKKYSLVEFIDNIADDYEEDESDGELEVQCENCEETNEGDEIFICDKCQISASHIQCDVALGGNYPSDQLNWYCNDCRQQPLLWFAYRSD